MTDPSVLPSRRGRPSAEVGDCLGQQTQGSRFGGRVGRPQDVLVEQPDIFGPTDPEGKDVLPRCHVSSEGPAVERLQYSLC